MQENEKHFKILNHLLCYQCFLGHGESVVHGPTRFWPILSKEKTMANGV